MSIRFITNNTEGRVLATRKIAGPVRLYVGCLISVFVLLSLAGCSTFRPQVTATEDALHYKLPNGMDNSRSREAMANRPVQIVRIDRGIRAQIGTWQLGVDGRYHAPLSRLDPRGCYAISNAQGNFVPLRFSNSDPYSFYLPRHAEVAKRASEFHGLERRREEIASEARKERSQYSKAKNWLASSGYYQNGECIKPPPKPAPIRPLSACSPSEAMAHGEKTCWGSFVVGYSCEKAHAMMNASGSGLAGLANSIQCSALAAEAQGSNLTLEGWFSDVLVDGPATKCMENLSKGQNIIANSLVCSIFVPLFMSKMEKCVSDQAGRCERAYRDWQSKVKEANDFPEQTVGICRDSLRVVAAGTSLADQLSESAASLTPELEAARDRLSQAKQKIGITEVAEFPCER